MYSLYVSTACQILLQEELLSILQRSAEPVQVLVRNTDQRSRDYGNIAYTYRPAAWNAFGMDKEGADFRACKNYGPLYK